MRIWWGQPIIDGELQDRSLRWCVELNGSTDRVDRELGRVPLDPIYDDVWTRCCGTPISEAEYKFLLQRKAWAENHAPDHPAANPRQAIDIRKLKPGW